MLSGKEFLNLEQVQQVKQNRREKLEKLTESLQSKTSQSTISPSTIPIEQQTEELDLSEEKALAANEPLAEKLNMSGQATSFVNIPRTDLPCNLHDLQPKPTATNRVVKFCESKNENKSSGWYTKDQIENNPNLLFLFGDNDDAKYRTNKSNPGGRGQAKITRPATGPYDRLPKDGGLNGNAIGITTTFYGCYIPTIDEFKVLMDREFDPIETWVKKGGCVIIPCNNEGKHSLGTGIAGLGSSIPGAIEYIQSKIDVLIELGQQQIRNPRDKELDILKQELHNTLSQECKAYHSSKSNKKLKNYLNGKDKYQKQERTSTLPTSQTKPEYNNIHIYSTLGGAVAGTVIAYLAGAATLTSLSVAVAMFIVSAAIGALVGYGIGKVSSKFLDPSITVPDPKGQGL